MLDQFSPIQQRLIMSGISISILIAAISLSFSPYFSFLVPLIAFVTFGGALKEYYNIAKLKKFTPREKTGFSITLGYILAIYLGALSGLQEHLPFIAMAIGLFILFIDFFFEGENPLGNIAVTLFGIIYLIIPLSCILQINYLYPLSSGQDGRLWVFYLLAVVYATDAAGLLTGKTFGRNKLAPYISPKKTWEGAIGGFIVAIFVSYLFYKFSIVPLNLLSSIILGTILGVLAQIGDLAESLLKREAGVKDSSKIPGLGGLLDVVDSLVFTAPFLYLYLKVQT